MERNRILSSILRNADVQLIWQKHGKDMVEETAKNAAYNQIGNQEIRNFRASSSWNLTTMGKYVMVPFWFAYYSYNGGKFYFLMDGIGERTEYTYPVNQEEAEFVNGKNKICKIVNWLWLLAIIMCFIFNFTTGLVTFVIWLIAKFAVRKVMDNQIQQKLDESRAQRQAGAARLQ